MSKIHLACRDGKYKDIERLLRNSDCDVNEKDNSGWAPIHIALHAKKFQVANLLLQHPDICVLSVTKDLSTPLHFAVRNREEPDESHWTALNTLIEKG